MPIHAFPRPLKPACTISHDYMRLTNRLPVRMETVPRQADSMLHNHEFYEIGIVTAGRARHVTNEGDEWLERGSVIIVAPGQVHGFSDTTKFGLVNIYYIAEWFLANLQALRDIDHLVPLFFQQALFPRRELGTVVQFRLTPRALEDCLGDLRQLHEECADTNPQPLFLEACLIKCLVRMARGYAISLAGVENEYTGSTLPPSVAHALRQLESRAALGQVPDMEQIARDSGVSLSYLCRLFKATTGMSAGAYFQRRRIHRACHRLLTTNSPATEIAYALGYSDGAHFSRLFKSTVGLSPRDYRRKFSTP